MREVCTVEAQVELDAGADDRALGGAVTVALCGALDHRGPCPVAPHRTAVEGTGTTARAQVVLVAEPDRRDEALRRVDAALAAGRLVDPDGIEQRWRLRSCRAVPMRDAERALGSRLAQPG